MFTRPSYQSGVGVAGTMRVVPDVAAVGNPGTGFGIYVGSQGGWMLAGGTSPATPLWAGQLSGVISTRQSITGLGDIHAPSHLHPAAFRDVSSGSNGLYSAGTGFDAVTGLRSPSWAALAQVLAPPGAWFPCPVRA